MSGSANFGNDPADYTTAGGGSVQTLLDASVGINSGWAFDQPKSADTVPTNAIQSMAPVDASSSASDGSWGAFWRGVATSVVGTAQQVVAQKNGIVQPASTMPVVTPPPNPGRVLLLGALAVGVYLIATRKGA